VIEEGTFAAAAVLVGSRLAEARVGNDVGAGPVPASSLRSGLKTPVLSAMLARGRPAWPRIVLMTTTPLAALEP
jgi:hypothetical protein